MYLNKNAEQTEKIISVPRIIEMSCRITQLRQTGMHSSNLQRCHRNLPVLFLRCYWIVAEVHRKLSKTSPIKSKGHNFTFHQRGGWVQRCTCQIRGMLEEIQRGFMRRIVEFCKIINWPNNSLTHPKKSYPFHFVSAWCSVLLPLLWDPPSCLWGHLLARSSLEKSSGPIRLLSSTAEVTWWASVDLWVLDIQNNMAQVCQKVFIAL